MTNASGVATVTLSDTTAEVVSVVAKIGVLTKSQAITFTPVVNRLNVSVQPTNGAVAADGVSTGTIIVNVKDVNNAPITGQLITFADGTTGGSAAQLSAASAITDASGTASITVKDPVAEAVSINATADTYTATGTINFALTTLSLVASAQTPFLADGNSNSVRITVKDQNGNLVPNQTFSVSSSSSTMIPSPISITTNASGV
ncbi:MAG: hypothetical protein CO186_07145, partial [Zetaproteobacteria bacterium CG_4_9_14_3_um_filter_49_83]